MDEHKPSRTKRREISPSPIATADDFFAMSGSKFQGIISDIRASKDDGTRPIPSATLVDRSTLWHRPSVLRLDYVPDLVDENLAGRSEMCLQFAQLIHLALSHVGMDSNAVAGTAMTKEKNSSMGTFEGQMSVQDPIWQWPIAKLNEPDDTSFHVETDYFIPHRRSKEADMTTSKLTQSDLDQFTGSENWYRHGQKMFEVIPLNYPVEMSELLRT